MHVVYFHFDSSSLTVDATAALQSIGAAASADPQGISERRARSVADFLLSRGIDASRVSTQDYESSRPAGGDDESGWAMNRRVEILLLK